MTLALAYMLCYLSATLLQIQNLTLVLKIE